MSEGVAAGRGRRLLATLVDLVLVPALAVFLVMAFGVTEHAEDFTSGAWVGKVLALSVAAYLLLNGYLLWTRGQTVGKALLGICIVDAGGGRAPLWKLVCIRALFFPFMYLIVIWPLTLLPLADVALVFTRSRRCLHDLAAGTRVVTVERRLNTGSDTTPAPAA